MIQVFKTDEDYKKWLDGQRLPSGIVVYVSDDETMYFSTNNIKGELKTYKCEKDEVIQYPPLIYSAKSAGSTITVNGQSITLEQGDNMVLEYPTAITSVTATSNEELTYLQIPNTVTSINDNAFGDCVALTSITLPDSLTSIGVGAFQCCIGLTSINIPSGVTSISMETFNGCSALASVTLPEGLTNIGSSTFMDCTSLTSITIPSTVTMIDFEAFNYCEALTDFNFNGTMEQWASITLGNNWKNNAAFTVVHCTDGDVSLEEPIQPIQPNNLVYSTNAAGSKLIVNDARVALDYGENIVLDYPSEITRVIGKNNTALTAITIPNTVTSIESNAFYGCASLASVNIPDTVTSIGDSAFTRSSLTSITIPDGVTSIESNAFNGCGSLVSINIPEGITSISGFVFGMCTSLTSISIPNSVTSIGEYSFQLCSSLTSITIPENVTSIGDNAFQGCAALTDFNFNGTKAQWASITLGNSWKYNAAFTVVHCTDGDVTL